MGPDQVWEEVWIGLEAIQSAGWFVLLAVFLNYVIFSFKKPEENRNPYDKYLPPTKRKYTNESSDSEEGSKRKNIIPLPVNDSE